MSNFLDSLERFLVDNPEVTSSGLGWQSLKDPSFVEDVRRGRSPSLKTVGKVKTWMKNYKKTKRSGKKTMGNGAVTADPINEGDPSIFEMQS